MIDNKINDTVATSYEGRIKEDSTNSQQDNSETVTNKNNKEIRRERYIYIYIYKALIILILI